MPSPVRLLLVVLAAVAIALVLRSVVGSPEEGTGDGVRGSPANWAPRTPTGRIPNFHLELSAEDRLAEARRCLDVLTTEQAEVLGAVKDDLALLCHWPDVRRMVLEDFESRARLNRYEGTAFASIFHLVRSPDFVEPVQRLFGHAESTVRQSALTAAATQKAPELVRSVLDYYRAFEAQFPGQGMMTRLTILDIAVSSGGDLVPAVIAAMLEDSDQLVRTKAADIAGRRGYRSLAGNILRSTLEVGEDQRAVMMAALARLGDQAGRTAVIEGLDPRVPAVASECLEVVRDLKLTEALDALVRHVQNAEPDLGPLYALAIAAAGGEETIAGWGREAADSRPYLWHLCARAYRGTDDDLRFLRALVADDPTREQVSSIAFGMQYREAGPDEQLVRGMFEAQVLERAIDYGVWVTNLPDAIMPLLEKGLANARDPVETQLWMELLAAPMSAAGRTALLEQRGRAPSGHSDPRLHRRLVEERVRVLDLTSMRMKGRILTGP